MGVLLRHVKSTCVTHSIGFYRKQWDHFREGRGHVPDLATHYHRGDSLQR